MITLTSSDTVSISAPSCLVYASYRDVTESTYTFGRVTGTTISSPAASTIREVVYLSIRNTSGSSQSVTITTASTVIKSFTLQAGDTWELTPEGARVLTSLGELRGLGATGATGAAGTNGALSVKTATLDFGSDAVRSAVLTVTDGTVTSGTRIIAMQADAEGEMDALILSCVAGAGQFTVYATAVPGPVTGTRTIHYQGA